MQQQAPDALLGKRILLLCPAFFSYEKLIKKEMERLGAKVAYYDERSVKSALSKAFLKVCPSIFNIQADAYFRKIIERHKGEHFDYVLIVRCDMVSVKIINELKKAFPEARRCLHLWDGIKNTPRITKKIHHFDYATSFEREDCVRIPFLRFRPVFFSDYFRHKEGDTQEYKYDAAFFGTIYADRLAIVQKLERQFKELNLSFYKFFYLQGKFMYPFYKLIKKSFLKVRYSDIAFKGLSHSEIAEIAQSSRVIIDIQHPKHFGLSVRIIDAVVGMRKKLITTNYDIVNYDLYDSANVYVIDRENPVIDPEFFSVPYKQLDEEVYDKYALRQWVLDVLGEGATD